VHNVLAASLDESYADGDLDGDGRPERYFQLPDCLAVIVQGATLWEIPALFSRRVGGNIEAVTLRITQRGGPTLEVTDLEGTQRQTRRFRWDGHALTDAP
jgi:hypothetical protein